MGRGRMEGQVHRGMEAEGMKLQNQVDLLISMTIHEE